MNVSAKSCNFIELNDIIRSSSEDIIIDDCYGERFIGASQTNKTITINGTPGNALGAYLDGANIVVNGNAQDAVGDTMNDGKIIINGSAGDALGYAMRGGKIYVKGNSGYRTGIHMKEYKEKKPVIVVGGNAGSFLGEYLAGGIIIVLGLSNEGSIVGEFTGTGMHGGEIWLRTDKKPEFLPKQVIVTKAKEADLEKISAHISEYAKTFNIDEKEIFNKSFYLLKPNAKNPYKQLYTEN